MLSVVTRIEKVTNLSNMVILEMGGRINGRQMGKYEGKRRNGWNEFH